MGPTDHDFCQNKQTKNTILILPKHKKKKNKKWKNKIKEINFVCLDFVEFNLSYSLISTNHN